MNNEMMPFFVFLLQSEDLKKQSERIIQEVRTSNDAKKFTDDFVASINDSEVIKKNLEFQKQQQKKLDEIKEMMVEIQNKLNALEASRARTEMPMEQ